MGTTLPYRNASDFDLQLMLVGVVAILDVRNRGMFKKWVNIHCFFINFYVVYSNLRTPYCSNVRMSITILSYTSANGLYCTHALRVFDAICVMHFARVWADKFSHL